MRQSVEGQKMKNRIPKLGLALSGGGFRASLFHLGVLAGLAENGFLRSVEVISTVSGGSVIGTMYFLYLKKLLESKRDSEISRGDYIDLIKSLKRDFVEGVQSNVRMQIYNNFASNVRMISSSRYSRVDRLAEVLDKTFYEPVTAKRYAPMKELLVYPAGEKRFHPRQHNRKRLAKVPMLIINSTLLNTGNNWQFYATGMSEVQPRVLFKEAPIFFKYSYGDPNLPMKYGFLPIGYAVASSCCVPGIFPPVRFESIDKKKIPAVVDGGVYDNLGIEPLLFEECSHLIVSDASGHLTVTRNPPKRLIPVVTRTNDIMMKIIKDARISALGLLFEKKATFFSIRNDIDLSELSFGGQAGTDPMERTSYGILKEVQLRISRIRTDLDSFTDVETESLMYSGYRIVRHQFGEKGTAKAFFIATHPHEEWDFERIEPFVTGKLETPRITRLLGIGREKLFKVFRLRPSLWFLGIAVATPPVALWIVLAYVFLEMGVAISESLVGGFPAVTSPLAIVLALPFVLFLITPFCMALFFAAYLKLINPVWLKSGEIH